MLEVPVTEKGPGLRLLAVYKSCVQDIRQELEEKKPIKLQSFSKNAKDRVLSMDS